MNEPTEPTERIRMRAGDKEEDITIIVVNRKLDEHMKLDDTRHELLMAAIEKTNESVQGVVEAWIVANALQRFVKWVSTFAILGAGILWFTTKFKIGGP